MSGLFDIQVKKQHNTWTTRKQWIRGTDADLLGECYAIYQKWGLSNLAVGMAAMEHVFGLDAKKRGFVVHAAQKVEEVRKSLMKGEAESRAVAQSGERPTITKEMVFARVKETQELEAVQTLAKLQTYEAELREEKDAQKITQLQGFVATARARLNDAREALMKGQGGYAETDYKAAMVALTPNVTSLEKMLEDSNKKASHSSSSGTSAPAEGKIDAKIATERVKDIWVKLLRAVVLQNIDRGQGEVFYEVTEKTEESVQHLRSLVSNEVAAVAAVVKGKGESFVSFTNRLQEKERFLVWMASVFTSSGPTEQKSLLEYAAGVLYETLKKVLPQANMWMALNSQQRGTGSGTSFNRLSAIIIEVYGKGGEPEEQTEQPKHVAMPALKVKGGLSRKQGTKVESEEKTEEHNKRVVTRYKPGDAPEEEGEDQDSDDGEAEDLPRVSFVKEEKGRGTKSPAKSQDRDGRAAWVGEGTDRGDEAGKDKLMTALEGMQASIRMIEKNQASQALMVERVPKPQGGSGECFEFAKKGTCKFGASCRFAHQGGERDGPAPPAYPGEAKRSNGSPQKVSRDQEKGEVCLNFARQGTCRFGSVCKFEHHQATGHLTKETQKRGREERKCGRAQQTGTCDIFSCDLSHGRWNKDTTSVCDKVREKVPCMHQWTEGGCRFSHNTRPPQQSSSRTDRRDPKNGGGLERATKRR